MLADVGIIKWHAFLGRKSGILDFAQELDNTRVFVFLEFPFECMALEMP